MCRTDCFDEEIARVLQGSGCKEVEFGIESFDDDVLKLLNKKATAADNMRTLKTAHDCGLNSRLLMMIRTPGQSVRTVPANIECLQKARFHMVACGYFIPIPGSAIWRDPGKYGIEIIDRNIEHYDFLPYNRFGERPRDVIRISGRSLEEVNKETEEFLGYLKSTNKMHRG